MSQSSCAFEAKLYGSLENENLGKPNLFIHDEDILTKDFRLQIQIKIYVMMLKKKINLVIDTH